MAQAIGVKSEIGRLRKVLVHSPGKELLAVTPSTRAEHLYDDIIDLEGAALEHRCFTSILRHFAEVLEVRELLETTLALPEARQFLLLRSEEATADHSLTTSLRDVPPPLLLQRYIEGWSMPAGPFSEKLEQPSYILPPLPNLFFPRDTAVVVGESVLIGAMRFNSRWPEEALMRTLWGFHPDFAGTPLLYDGSDERRHAYSIEGGDVHVLSEEVVLVGVSERTTVASLDVITHELFGRTNVTDIIAIVLPEHSTAIHLDMVWTQLDRELCAVHPPLFRGPVRAPVLHRHKGREVVTEWSSLFLALREVGLPMEPVFCGGPRRDMQEREQWASGCNFFALAPGQVLSYARNEETLRGLESAGFRIVDGRALVSGADGLKDGERAVITFTGAELVRGGGGPRCMTCPILRDPL